MKEYAVPILNARQSVSRRRVAVAVVACLLILAGLVGLERDRRGISMADATVGLTPVTLLQRPGASGPGVLIAHGFAGSRQFMDSFALTLVDAGYIVATYDLLGHGQNPAPMSGDVTTASGTTRLLVDEAARVADWLSRQPGVTPGLALIGHSMASDIVIRLGQARGDVAAVVAVSMYSEAVTADSPRQLLILTGQGEPHLRENALEALRMVDPEAQAGTTAASEGVQRRAAVAPWVGHVGVLYSDTSLTEARDWIDAAFDRNHDGRVISTSAPLAALLVGLLALAWPLAGLVPLRNHSPQILGRWRYAGAILIPVVAAPAVSALVPGTALPILGGANLAALLLVYGLAQLIVLRLSGLRLTRPDLIAAAGLTAFGILVFSAAMTNYAASFWPTGPRIGLFAVLLPGCFALMCADALINDGGQAPWPRRLISRIGIIVALAIGVATDVESLFMVSMMLPVLVLFFLVFGAMGRWVGLRAGPSTSGLGLAVLLAWSLAATMPIFDQETESDFAALLSVQPV
ncbi:MAG: alpha/beta fold hydrolase [Pseudomonadota bacterium]